MESGYCIYLIDILLDFISSGDSLRSVVTLGSFNKAQRNNNFFATCSRTFSLIGKEFSPVTLDDALKIFGKMMKNSLVKTPFDFYRREIIAKLLHGHYVGKPHYFRSEVF
jgi:hypothetical protein